MANVERVAGTDTQITVPDAARVLRLAGGDVYRLLFAGVLAGRPAEDGAVYISTASIERYLAQQAPQETASP